MITAQDALFIKVLFEMIQEELYDSNRAYAKLQEYMKVQSSEEQKNGI